MKQNLREILHRNFILVLFAFFALSSVFYILLPTLPIYLSKSGPAETEIGVLIGIYTISSLFLRPFVGKALRKIPEKTFMIAGTLLYSSISIAYLLAHSDTCLKTAAHRVRTESISKDSSIQ